MSSYDIEAKVTWYKRALITMINNDNKVKHDNNANNDNNKKNDNDDNTNSNDNNCRVT